ncbi:MAG: thioredoxin [Bacteroidales bacterium]|nr:thioredoxin [Bacteroidales bacterium]MBQ9311510.1 thioredoxin [Bacteroidales bacterium]
MAKQITDENFSTFLAEEKKLIVLDCGATWCGPCQHIAPIIDELAKEYEGKAEVCKADVDECSSVTSQFMIRNVPTVLFIKEGKVLDKLVGANTKATYVQYIEKYI